MRRVLPHLRLARQPLLAAGAGLLLTVVLIATAVQPGSARAADNELETMPLRIAILDIPRIFQNALAVKALQTKMRAYVEAYRAETEREEEGIRAAQQELAGKRDELSPELYETERRMLEKRLIEAQAQVQRRKLRLDQTQQEGMDMVQATLNAIVTDVANERGLTLILRKDQTVLNATALEITDVVLTRLNERLPSVEIAGPGLDATGTN